MQKQVLVQKGEDSFKIHTTLDIENSSYLVKLLFEYVEQGKITFELQSKKGSIISEILVNVAGGLFSAVLYDLAKKVYNQLKEEKKKGKEIKPIEIFTESKHYVITGDEKSVLPENL